VPKNIQSVLIEKIQINNFVTFSCTARPPAKKLGYHQTKGEVYSQSGIFNSAQL